MTMHLKWNCGQGAALAATLVLGALVPRVSAAAEGGSSNYTPGTYGNLARNALAGPSLRQLDITLSKRFRLAENTNLEFRSEFYNILNIANFANPPASLNPTLGASLQPGQPLSYATAGSGAFGILNRTVSNQIGLGTNRQVQLALRLSF